LLCRALRAGESLADPASWKNRQLLSTAILAILYLLVTFMPVPLAPDDINAIASGLSLLGGTINGYLTVATTEKVGLPDKAALLEKAAGFIKSPVIIGSVVLSGSALIYWWYV